MPAITYYGPAEGWEGLRAELESEGAEVKQFADYALDPVAAAEFIMTTAAVLGIERSIEAAIRRVKSRFKAANVEIDRWFIAKCAGGCEAYEVHVLADQYFRDSTLPLCPRGHSMRIAGLAKE